MPRILRSVLVTLALALLVTVVLGHAMTAGVDRDENMYVGAGVLSRTAPLYVDVPFLQMPYLPWILAGVLPPADGSALLLPARLFTVVCAAFVLLALVMIPVRRGAGPWPGLAIAALLVVQPTFLAAAREATNHLPPLAAFAGAMWVLSAGTTRRALLGAGVLLGVATGLRLTWIVVAIAVAAAVVLTSRETRAIDRGRDGMLVLAGTGLGLAPALVAALADAGAFVFQNVTYHAINRAWAIESGLPWALGRSALLDAIDGLLREQSTHGLLIAVLAAIVIAWRAALDRPRLLAMAFVVAGGFAASALPSPWWSRHALPLVGTLAFATVVLLPPRTSVPRVFAIVLAIGVVVGLTGRGARHAEAIGHAFDSAAWVPVTFHRDAQALAGTAERVRTLAPLPALEAGLNVDPRSAAGPFLVRVRDRLDPGAPTAGGETVLDVDRRDAYLIGVEPDFEGDARQRLRAAGFAPEVTAADGAELWTHDDGSGP